MEGRKENGRKEGKWKENGRKMEGKWKEGSWKELRLEGTKAGRKERRKEGRKQGKQQMSRSGALFCNVGQFTWWLRAAVKHLGTDSPIITANALQIIPLRKSYSIPWRTWRGSGSQGQWLRRQRSYRQPSPKQQVSRWQLLVSTCIGAVACLQFLHLIYFRRAWLLARTKICP